ncbi:hypothetical protein JL722_694 [Aureococcus anophagefferens]|nr:hypothetical protein JL722_694 [Aureococcus anophagefferens]
MAGLTRVLAFALVVGLAVGRGPAAPAPAPAARRRAPAKLSPAVSRGGASPPEDLTLRQHAIAGALARAVAQSAVHPLNVCKTVLQGRDGAAALRALTAAGPLSPRTWRALSRGLGAQALLSLPNGALNFCAMEGARRAIDAALALSGGSAPRPLVDAASAGVGTVVGTFVSLPQSILGDRIMAGTYPTLGAALRGVGARNLWPRATWVAALAAKVPAYSLNWVAYQRLRRAELRRTRGRTPTPARDVFLGACAASISVCVMIPLDTVKVRMTTGNLGLPYAHVGEAIGTMLRTEGAAAALRTTDAPPPMAVYAKLRGRIVYADNDVDEGHPELHLPVSSTRVVLGRSGAAGPAPPGFLGVSHSKSVSRSHCTIEWRAEDNTWSLTCASKNGLVVDRRFVGKGSVAPLAHRSAIKFGPCAASTSSAS